MSSCSDPKRPTLPCEPFSAACPQTRLTTSPGLHCTDGAIRPWLPGSAFCPESTRNCVHPLPGAFHTVPAHCSNHGASRTRSLEHAEQHNKNRKQVNPAIGAKGQRKSSTTVQLVYACDRHQVYQKAKSFTSEPPKLTKATRSKLLTRSVP